MLGYFSSHCSMKYYIKYNYMKAPCSFGSFLTKFLILFSSVLYFVIVSLCHRNSGKRNIEIIISGQCYGEHMLILLAGNLPHRRFLRFFGC